MLAQRLPSTSIAVCRHHQQGAGLIEVLIAVLIVAIAFIGISALQARALSNSGQASSKSMAVMTGYSILDAMRIDREHAASYVNKTVSAGQCQSSGASGLAKIHLDDWCKALETNVSPQATGEIKRSKVKDDTYLYSVTIDFHDDEDKVVVKAVL